MTAKNGPLFPVRIILMLMALMLAMTPMTFASAALVEDEATPEATAGSEVPAPVATEALAPADETTVVDGSAPTEATETAQSAEAAVETVEKAATPATPRADANNTGPYDSTSDGSPSGNGNGDNGNKPCAGCVGNADDKNPPGQLPGPEDDNNGYECDGNSGVGKTNPAHSGCKSDEPDPDPAIDLEKSGPTEAEIGEVITYTFDVTNSGDRALSDVHITDPLLGSGDIAVTPSTLPVGATGEATAEYTVDADDVTPANEVPNTATVHGTDPDGTEVTDDDSWVVEVPPIIVIPKMHTFCHATGNPTKFVVLTTDTDGIVNGHLATSPHAHHQAGRDIVPPFVYDRDGKTYSQNWDAAGQAIFDAGCQTADSPAIDLEKSGPTDVEVGEVITYTFDVTNTGDVPLTDVHVTDPLLGGATIAVTPSSLEPEEEGEATATYTVAEEDILDDDTIPNTATAHGTPPQGDDVSAVDSHVVQVVRIPGGDVPSIALDKGGPDSARIGDVITYTFDVTNTGDTSLTDVHVTDPLLGGAPIAVTPSTLAPDGEGTATAEYTVAEADIVEDEVPHVPNTATAHGTPPVGADVIATDSHVVTVPAIVDAPDPAIHLEKDGPASARVDDTITYTFTVTNTGDVTLTNVRVRDPLLGARILPVTPSTLAAGARGTASATYTVSEADGEAGSVLNTAVARGTPPRGPDVRDTDDHTVEVPDVTEAPEPGIEFEKSGPASARVGDTITYRFRATNTGETTLTDVHISDMRLGIQNLAVTPSTLAPGESGTARATYTVTKTDGAAGFVFNTAIVTGNPPDGPPVTDRDDHTTDVPGTPPVAPPDEDLPATGSDVGTQLLLAMTALLVGAALLLSSRRTVPAFDSWSVGGTGPRLAGTQSPRPVHHRPGRGPRLAG